MAAITGGTGGLASYFTAKINGKYGRNVAIAIALCLDISTYLLSLFWIPNEKSLWVAYIVFVFYGLTNGTWQALVNGNSGYLFFLHQKNVKNNTIFLIHMKHSLVAYL